jgi:RNA polymerase sigma-70 factor (ECF subfamily)
MKGPEREQFLEELESHFDSLYSYARWITNGNEEAEDLVHDAVSRAISHWTQFETRPSMKAWLFTILKRTYLNRIRRAKIEVNSSRYPESDDRVSSGEGRSDPRRLPANLIRRDIEAALSSLSEGKQSLIVLADIEGLTLLEISEVEEIPVGTVKSRLWRARKELRAMLMDYQGSSE